MSMYVLAISPGKGFEPQAWRRVLRSGIDGLMIREKHLEARALLDLTRRAQDLAPEVELWVNGRLDVALRAACGLHAPETYPEVPSSICPLSRPLHAVADFPNRAEAQQLLLSPIFAVPGKGEPLGAAGLHRWLEALPPFRGRLVALGGITRENVSSLKHSRLGGVALIRTLWDAADPGAVVETLKAAW